MAGRVFVGTSGWHYKHWRGSFYPEDLAPNDWLRYYAGKFDTVELNNSFYHLPKPSTFKGWRLETPEKFVFAVKGSRFITHMKKLKAPKTSTKRFFARTEKLQQKLGPVLFQLPPHWKVNWERLNSFLKAIPQKNDYAVEFRDSSWLIKETYQVLEENNAALCFQDLHGQESPLELTADFAYIRFHGPTKASYSGSYSRAQLEKWAEKIKEWRHKLNAVYVYFNNDNGGHAPRNAATLRELLQ